MLCTLVRALGDVTATSVNWATSSTDLADRQSQHGNMAHLWRPSLLSSDPPKHRNGSPHIWTCPQASNRTAFISPASCDCKRQPREGSRADHHFALSSPPPIRVAVCRSILERAKHPNVSHELRADLRFGTIPRMVRSSAEAFGNGDAIIDGTHHLSFSDVEAEMVAVASSLIALGVEPGDRVALWAANSAAWIASASGILAARALLVPLNTRLKGDEAAYILAKTDARVLLAADGFLGTQYIESVRRVAPELRAMNHAYSMPLPGASGSAAWEEFLNLGRTLPESTITSSIDAAAPGDVSDIIFTSGTTGAPKGVMLRHDASLRGYEIFAEHFELKRGDRYVVPTPFFHCFGYKAGWMISLMTGATAYPLAVFSVEDLLPLIQREAITHMPGPPTMFQGLVDHPERSRFDLSSLDHAMIGAASIPAPLIHRMRDELAIPNILAGYGLTENHALCTLTDPLDPAEVVATRVGKPLPGIEVRVVDEAGADVSPGADGELLLAGPFQMSGYFDDPQATDVAIVEGWLHTGDVGHFDPLGYLSITDRKKDMYIMGGFNVAPVEVERALLGMEGIAQAAVVGLKDTYFGEVGAAFVVLHEGSTLTPDDVLAYAKEHLANYKVPRQVQVVTALPQNATGKVLKNELRDRLMNTARPESKPA